MRRFAPAAALLLLAACSRAPEGPLAARVNGEPITLAQLDAEQRFLALPGPAAPGAGLEALEGLVDQTLILQEGRKLGLRFTDADRANAEAQALAGTGTQLLDESLKARGLTRDQWRDRLDRAAEADAVVGLAVRNNLEVTHQEVQDHYWENLPLYRRPERRVLRQVFTRSRPAAEGALRELELGEPFGEVAASRGQGPEAASQGMLGALSRGQLPKALAKAAWALKPGTWSQIVASHWGYHILYCENRLAPESDTLVQAEPQARGTLLREKELMFFRSWLARLRESAAIEHLVVLEAPGPTKAPREKGKS